MKNGIRNVVLAATATLIASVDGVPRAGEGPPRLTACADCVPKCCIERAGLGGGPRVAVASAPHHFRLDPRLATVSGAYENLAAGTGSGLQVVLTGHKNHALSAGFSPDGSRIVIASADKTAQISDTATGKELAVLGGRQHQVNSAAFSPDGARVITSDHDDAARIWDAATGKELAVLIGGIWEDDRPAFPTNEELAVLRGHEDGVSAAEFSPDGSRILTTSDDKTARIWNAAPGK